MRAPRHLSELDVGADAGGLVCEALQRGQRISMRASGGSMLPTFRPGDLLEVDGQPPVVGEIGVVWNGVSFIAHRVIAVDGDSFVLRGDAAGASEHVEPANRVVGRVLDVRRTPRAWVTYLRYAGTRIGYRAVQRLLRLATSGEVSAQRDIQVRRLLYNVVQRGEARLRGRLPRRFGGRITAREVEARPLAPEDVSAYWRLLRPGQAAADAEVLPRNGFAMGLWLEDELVAVGACAQQWQTLDVPGWWLGGDFVHSRWRRRGLGQLLHRARIEAARERELERLYANVYADNGAALAALLAAGFSVLREPDWEQRIREHLHQAGGRDVRQVILACDL